MCFSARLAGHRGVHWAARHVLGRVVDEAFPFGTIDALHANHGLAAPTTVRDAERFREGTPQQTRTRHGIPSRARSCARAVVRRRAVPSFPFARAVRRGRPPNPPPAPPLPISLRPSLSSRSLRTPRELRDERTSPSVSSTVTSESASENQPGLSSSTIVTVATSPMAASRAFATTLSSSRARAARDARWWRSVVSYRAQWCCEGSRARAL